MKNATFPTHATLLYITFIHSQKVDTRNIALIASSFFTGCKHLRNLFHLPLLLNLTVLSSNSCSYLLT